jgi:cell division protease FtsH
MPKYRPGWRSRLKVQLFLLLNVWRVISLVVSIATLLIYQAYKYLLSESELESNYRSGVKFSDIGGMEEVKQEMSELIDFFNVDNASFARMGARLKRGTLLHGPPGTGKTLIAKATAGECDAKFIYCSASDLMLVYFGSGSSKIREIFQRANELKPCIVFIDEIDALGSRTNDKAMVQETASMEKNATISQLLTELDGFRDRNNIFLIAATNNIDAVDPALLRPGRFDKTIATRLPNFEERKTILSFKLKKIQNEVSAEMINQIANLKDFSGADLDTILNEAAITSLGQGLDKINDRILFDTAHLFL